MSAENKFCQSCSLPMKKDPQGGGTDANGNKSGKYCSYCYQDGDFLFHGTVGEFQDFCRKEMIKSGHSRFISWLFTRNFARLERWKN